MALTFKNPATYLIAGVTGSGKSHFVKKLLENKDKHFENPPGSVLYLYGAWQDGFTEMEKWRNVKFYNGLPSSTQVACCSFKTYLLKIYVE